MDIWKIGIEYYKNKLCLVIYYENYSKEIIFIKNKYKDKLLNLLLDIQRG